MNLVGPIMGAPGHVVSCNHVGFFQFAPAPAAGNQSQPELAVGVPNPGVAAVTSYDSGHGSWTSVCTPHVCCVACAPARCPNAQAQHHRAPQELERWTKMAWRVLRLKGLV